MWDDARWRWSTPEQRRHRNRGNATQSGSAGVNKAHRRYGNILTNVVMAVVHDERQAMASFDRGVAGRAGFSCNPVSGWSRRWSCGGCGLGGTGCRLALVGAWEQGGLGDPICGARVFLPRTWASGQCRFEQSHAGPPGPDPRYNQPDELPTLILAISPPGAKYLNMAPQSLASCPDLHPLSFQSCLAFLRRSGRH